MSRSRLRSVLLLAVAVPTIITGAWALLAPHGWHDDFPGFGRDWVAAFGVFNEHATRDYGGALLGLGLLLAWPVVSPRTPLRVAAPVAFLCFAAPHFAFHVAHIGELPTGDEIVNQTLNALSVAIPLALLFLSGDAPAHPHAGASSGREGWRLPAAPERGLIRRLTYIVSRRRYGHVLGPLAVIAHNPTLLAGYSTFELALERAVGDDRRLADLGATRAATMTGCPFCIDFAGAELRRLEFTPGQIQAVANWRASSEFSLVERLVLEYAEAMTTTPVEVSDELFERLRARFDERTIVGLTAAIAIENYRGRFNHAVGLGSEGFCELPVAGNGRPAATARV
jgi:AhpD family alkylhydroperoxidase